MRAALAALAAAALLVAALQAAALGEIRRHVERFNVDEQYDKLLGVAVQEEAYRDDTLLPVYGSSELTQPQTNRADDFFRAHPTGFGAFLIGCPGENSLMIATKLAALDPAKTVGKRAVVFLSPGWFCTPALEHRGFGVNFSPLHGTIFAFESQLSPALKADISRRLLDYPEIVGQSPLLDAALRCLRDRTPGDRAWLAMLKPLGAAQNRVQRVMDCFESAQYWWHTRHDPVPPPLDPPLPPGTVLMPARAPAPGGIDWKARLREADAFYAHQPALTDYSTGPRTAFDDQCQRLFRKPNHPENSPDQNFAQVCFGSKEWTDLDLMLRTAQEKKIRLLIVCQPLNAKFNRLQGLTAQSEAAFYRHLQDAVAPYKVPMATYVNGEADPHFYRDCTHPSAKAWVAYDYALDQFFHRGTTPDRL